MSERLMGWTNNLQEIKRTNRYELLIPGDDALRLTCKSVTMPSTNVDQTLIHRMHLEYKVAGSKIHYPDVSVTFYDFVDNAAAKALEVWHTQVYDIGNSLMGFPSAYKRNLTLLVYGPDHSVVESWLLIGAWPKEFKRKDLSWETTDGQEVSLTLSIDEAQLVLTA